MKNDTYCPDNLREAILYFNDPEVCHHFMVELRWADGVTCPHCGASEVTFFTTNKTKGGTTRRLWQCRNKECKKQFSTKTGTLFEDSPLPLEKWLPAVWLIVSAKNGISSYELHRALGVTQKTAWFMLHRIRTALQEGTFEKMNGTVEADETFIGGKASNMHKSKRAEKIHGRGTVGKEVVMGLLDRGERKDAQSKKKKVGKHSKVRVKHVPDTTAKTLQGEVKAIVEGGSEVFTDAALGYHGLNPEYVHRFIDHAVTYVEGNVHTNNLENFWTLLKRSLKGTYVSVNAEHLFRYLDEQAFRFNEREIGDAQRFMLALSQITGRRLTYAELTG